MQVVTKARPAFVTTCWVSRSWVRCHPYASTIMINSPRGDTNTTEEFRQGGCLMEGERVPKTPKVCEKNFRTNHWILDFEGGAEAP